MDTTLSRLMCRRSLGDSSNPVSIVVSDILLALDRAIIMLPSLRAIACEQAPVCNPDEAMPRGDVSTILT
jgi:hypothetical protein